MRKAVSSLLGASPTWLAVVSALLLAAVTARTPQGLFSDAGWQLYAASQHADGVSPSLFIRVNPDPADLARDVKLPMSWWAPGVVLVAYPLMRAGLSVGAAVRLAVLLSLLVGAVGWARWIRLFELPTWMTLLASAFLPWMRYASNNLFYFSAEVFVFATVPWALLATRRLAAQWAAGQRQSEGRSKAMLRAFGTGLILGGPYLLKYSIALTTIGALILLVGLFLSLHRNRVRLDWLESPFAGPPGSKGHVMDRHAPRIEELMALGAGFAAPIGILTVVNRLHGAAANLLTASVAWHVHWESAAWALAAPGLVIGDIDGLARFVLLNPSRPLVGDDRAIVIIGLLAAPLIVWVLLRRRILDSLALVTLAVLASALVSIVSIWNISTGVSFDSRHVAGACLALLPLVLREGYRAWSDGTPLGRLALTVGAATYLVIPVGYGAASVFGKVARLPSGYRTGRAGIYNPLLAVRDLASCGERLEHRFSGPDAVWYIPEPITALDLRGRALLSHADFTALPILRDARYNSSRPLRIYVLIPDYFEKNGKGEAIRKSFGGASGWSTIQLSACEYRLWTATLVR